MRKMILEKAKKLGLIEETPEDILLSTTEKKIYKLKSKINSIQSSLVKEVNVSFSHYPYSWNRNPVYKEISLIDKMDTVPKPMFKKLNPKLKPIRNKIKIEEKIEKAENERDNMQLGKTSLRDKENPELTDILSADLKGFGNFVFSHLEYPDLNKLDLNKYKPYHNKDKVNSIGDIYPTYEKRLLPKKIHYQQNQRTSFVKKKNEYVKKATINTIVSERHLTEDSVKNDDSVNQTVMIKDRFRSPKELGKYLNFFTKSKRKINYLINKTGDTTIDERNLNVQNKLNKEFEYKPQFPPRVKKLMKDTAGNKSYHYLRNHITKDTFHLSDSLIDKLSTKDFKGPYSSFCNFCLTKNMNFYSALDEKQAKNIVNLIK